MKIFITATITTHVEITEEEYDNLDEEKVRQLFDEALSNGNFYVEDIDW